MFGITGRVGRRPIETPGGFLVAWMLGIGAAAWSISAAAYPTRPIDLYIGSAPSGSTDALGRVLARSLEGVLGQPVVVHNAPGAGGAVMATQLRSSAPDGYSIGMTISHAFTGNPIVMPEVTPYSVDEFTHLASVSKGQCALVTSTEKPWTSIEDLVAAARQGAKPVFASQSPLSRIVVDYMAAAEDVEFRVITVQGGGEIMQSVLGGHADFGFSGGPHISFVAAGKMRVLASVEDSRLLTSPEIPTLKELGYDISSCSTFVVSAPPLLPDDIRTTLAEALREAIDSVAMQALIANLQYPRYYLGPDEVTAALESEADMLERAVASVAAGDRGQADARLSPYFMPIVALVVGFGAIAALTTGRLTHGRAPGQPVQSRDGFVFIGMAGALLLGCFAAMQLLGYVPGAIGIVAGFMLLGRAGLRVAIGSAVVLPLVLWFLFSELLGFPLP